MILVSMKVKALQATMQKRKNIVFDLLRNEHFVRWVQHPTQESNYYWTKWISNHESDKSDVEIARRIIQSGSLTRNQSVSDEHYDIMLENIMNYAREKQTNYSNKTGTLRYLSIAAAVLLVIVSSVFLITDHFKSPVGLAEVRTVVKEAPNGSKLSTKLPDGTTVTLNSGSVLSFPEKFEGAVRNVRLSGEAFFEVEHDPSKPFIVHFRDQEVKVLGTSFNIRAYEPEDLTEVAVATGKVSYSLLQGSQVILKPNEMARYSQEENKLEKGTVNKLAAFGWRDRILYFESNSFEEIKTELERWFGVTIKASRHFKPHGTYSGQFNNASIKEILTGLSFIYRFDYSIEGSQVTITSQSD